MARLPNLSFYVKKTVIQALENVGGTTNGVDCDLLRVFNASRMEFRRGVFQNDWRWFYNDTDYDEDDHYNLFRMVHMYAWIVLNLDRHEYVELIRFYGITHRRGRYVHRFYAHAGAA